MRTKKKLPILITSLELGDKRDYYNNGICGEIHDLFNKGLASYEITMILKFLWLINPQKIINIIHFLIHLILKMILHGGGLL
jgi:hypothetical protein